MVSAICDVATRGVVDVIEGRQAPDLNTWLTAQPAVWTAGVKVTVTDLHEPFRTALAKHLPNATAVADAFHVVAVGTRALDRTRRRVQQETLGHRGRKADPLYRSRKLLTLAAERLDDKSTAKLRGLLAAGDPTARCTKPGQPRKCSGTSTRSGVPRTLPGPGWMGSSPTAALAPGRRFAAWPARSSSGPRRSRPPHTTGYTNGSVEGLNSLIKKVKRVAAGFRSFTTYRLPILLAVGGCNWELLGTHPR